MVLGRSNASTILSVCISLLTCSQPLSNSQLERYERELNGGSRPPFRLISTQDAPASYPMVLCVSNITWSEGGPADDGTPTEPHPELEVTDGWYRLRAQVDAPLARAIRRGIIRVGRKIGVAGARVGFNIFLTIASQKG